MADISGGWSKNQRDWFFRIGKKAHKLSGRCNKKSKFYLDLARKFLHAEPDGIWRYVMVMAAGWGKCVDVWSDIAEEFLNKVDEIDCPDMPVDEIDE